jgi:hypothetical protein
MKIVLCAAASRHLRTGPDPLTRGAASPYLGVRPGGDVCAICAQFRGSSPGAGFVEASTRGKGPGTIAVGQPGGVAGTGSRRGLPDACPT